MENVGEFEGHAQKFQRTQRKAEWERKKGRAKWEEQYV